MLTYEQLCAVVRKHADHVFPEGFVKHGTIDGFGDSNKLPRQMMREEVQRRTPSEFVSLQRDPTASLTDLWAIGMEKVLADVIMSQREWDPDMMRGYEIEMIGGFDERCGFRILGEETPEAHETIFDQLEDKRQFLHTVNHDDEYLLMAHGLHSVDVALLADYPDIKVYHVTIYEGEGWWSTFTFAVRKGELE